MENTNNKSVHRWRRALVLILVAGIGFVIWYGSRPAGTEGPVIAGRPASVWVDHFATNGVHGDSALEALRSDPARSIPYLASVVQGTSWREDLWRTAREHANPWTANRVGSRLASGLTRSIEHRRAAAKILGKLEAAAEPAVPVLLAEVEEPWTRGGFDTILVSNAIVALHQIAPLNEDAAYATMLKLRIGSGFDLPQSQAAFQTLADLAPENRSLIPGIIHSLRSRNTDAYTSLTAIRRAGPDPSPGVTEQMLGLLPSPDPAIREAALYRFVESLPRESKYPVSSTVSAAIANALQDVSPEVRILAVEGSLKIGTASSNEVAAVVAELLNETDYSIRLRAVEALRQQRDVWPDAASLLQKHGESDPARIVRTWAVVEP